MCFFKQAAIFNNDKKKAKAGSCIGGVAQNFRYNLYFLLNKDGVARHSEQPKNGLSN